MKYNGELGMWICNDDVEIDVKQLQIAASLNRSLGNSLYIYLTTPEGLHAFTYYISSPSVLVIDVRPTGLEAQIKEIGFMGEGVAGEVVA